MYDTMSVKEMQDYIFSSKKQSILNNWNALWPLCLLSSVGSRGERLLISEVVIVEGTLNKTSANKDM